MESAILLVLAGLFGLALGGDFLVRGSVGIARRLGVSNLVTGLVIVGFATSMPEMVASVEAALLGSPGIAWGNIVGSNLSNSLLILGVTAVVMPIALTGLGRRDANVALVATVILAMLAWLQLSGTWTGIALLLAIVAYVYWRYNHPRAQEEGEADGSPPLHIGLAMLAFLAGLAALVVGGQALVTGAIDLARLAGVSETVIGLTVVAVGTSLPELAASIAAAFRGKPGLALGNVVGSNIYNILLIGGTTMVIAPGPLPTELTDFELPLLVLAASVLALVLWRAKRIGRIIGIVLVATFAAYVAVLFA